MNRSPLIRTRSLNDCCRDKREREGTSAPVMDRSEPIAKVGKKKREKLPRETKFKASIRRRDDWTCQKCGHPGNEVHHIFPVGFGSHLDLEFEAWNCITLCPFCHRLGNDAAHRDMTAFREWTADTFPRFAEKYDRELDLPLRKEAPHGF